LKFSKERLTKQPLTRKM